MKPVAVLQYHASDGPAYFATHLRHRAVPSRVFRLCAGEPAPADLTAYSGLSLLGGPMSANQLLPAQRAGMRLIHEAFRRGLPVIGHCLGGQLMARALGERVAPAAVPEIGWATLRTTTAVIARDWLPPGSFAAFQWHYESFGVPPGATLIATGAHCRHQAFVIDDRHLAMQFHGEIDAEKVARWLDPAASLELRAAAASPAVQQPAAIRAATAVRLGAAHRAAARLFDRWLKGLPR